MELDVADMVADMEVEMVADMKVDKVVDMVADIKADKKIGQHGVGYGTHLLDFASLLGGGSP